MIAVIALVMGIAGSAFSTSKTAGKDTSTFYRYMSTSTDVEEVKSISNYQSSILGCGGGSHVCGVQLTTAKVLEAQPDPEEFDDVKAALGQSETSGEAQLPTISMRD